MGLENATHVQAGWDVPGLVPKVFLRLGKSVLILSSRC